MAPLPFPGEPEPDREALLKPMKWWEIAPKSLQYAATILLAMAVGALVTEVKGGWSNRIQNLESALKDAPTKYQVRLSERVGQVEGKTDDILRRVDRIEKKVDDGSAERTAQFARLSAQVELLLQRTK